MSLIGTLLAHTVQCPWVTMMAIFAGFISQAALVIVVGANAYKHAHNSLCLHISVSDRLSGKLS